ncbi:MAG: type II and III secretion system protein family protein [Novosphingobium sp.]|nr:type II and III secretion system protein family protein [Novosphingobium sp.]
MDRRVISTLLTAACAVAPLAFVPLGAAHAQTVTRPVGNIVLSIGRGQLITTPGRMTDVFVADDKVADVQVKSDHQLYIFGKGGGETTVYASDAAGNTIWSANVRVGSNIDSVDQMLRVAMPDAKVSVSTMGVNTFLLTGTVGAPEDAAEAERLVAAFVGKDANVISRLRMATPLQVNLQVRISEVSRSLVKSLGVNLNSIDRSSGFKFGIGQGRAFTPQQTAGQTALIIGTQGSAGTSVITPLTGSTTLGFAGKFLGLDLLGALDAGETAGLVSTLAEPNLTALSGETADFLAGGEFPIPMSQGLGTTTIEYKKFGISLAYTPTVLANGRISLRVRPEVSELSSEGALQQGGFSIPSLTVRRAETTVELGSGQSFMIAGLMKNSSQNTVKKLPGAGDIPILGSLFRSTNFQKGETELVIVVTPYLVNPVNGSEIKLPTDGYRDANDIQRVLGNMLTDGKSGAVAPKPSSAGAPVAPPRIGSLGAPAAPAPVRPADTRGSKQRTAVAAPAPGFSLK